MDLNACECVDQREYLKIHAITAFCYGSLIGIIFALLLEIAVSPYISYFYVAVLCAPIFEELIKSLIVYGEKITERIYLVVILCSIGFGLGEWVFHSMLAYNFAISITILLHPLMTLPVAILWAKRQTKSNYLIGLIIAISLHACWNYAVLTL